MINAASPDLSSKTCGSVRAHATDRRWKTSFDFHRRPGVGVGAMGALLRDCHQNSWVIFKWPNSWINPFRLAWLHLCLCYTKRMGGKEKKGRARITSESQKGLILRVQTRRSAENEPPCTNSSTGHPAFQTLSAASSCCVQIKRESFWIYRFIRSQWEHLQLSLLQWEDVSPPGHLLTLVSVSGANVHLRVI